MNRARFSFLATVVFAVVFASDAWATAARTFVASTGDDANTATNCGRAAPCRNFSFAYSVTSAGGEIVAMDSAGFGGINITGPVTITALPGQRAFVNVTASAIGFTVTAGAGNVVVLENLNISGTNASNTTGIQINSGKVIIRNSSFSELVWGVNNSNSKVDIVDCYFQGNTSGVRTVGTGTDVSPQYGAVVYGPTSTRVEGGSFNFNTNAFETVSPGARVCDVPCGGTKYNIFVHAPNGVWTTNAAGNDNLMVGSGAECVVDPNYCIFPWTYSGGSNPR
jgi:hypothetical protein